MAKFHALTLLSTCCEAAARAPEFRSCAKPFAAGSVEPEVSGEFCAAFCGDLRFRVQPVDFQQYASVRIAIPTLHSVLKLLNA